MNTFPNLAIKCLSAIHGCWSAERWTSECHACQRVERCPLPEGLESHVKLCEQRLNALTLTHAKERAIAQTALERALEIRDARNA